MNVNTMTVNTIFVCCSKKCVLHARDRVYVQQSRGPGNALSLYPRPRVSLLN